MGFWQISQKPNEIQPWSFDKIDPLDMIQQEPPKTKIRPNSP